MNQPLQARHARGFQAGIQEGRGVDSRLRTAGMTKEPTSSDRFIGPIDRPAAADPVLSMSGAPFGSYWVLPVLPEPFDGAQDLPVEGRVAIYS
jgi:hypothetical protein